MPVHQSPLKAAICSSEMAHLCQLSRSRFYSLTKAGIFPEPIKSKSSKRPIYDQKLQQKCLDVRWSCIGFNGEPILFNRKSKDRPAKAQAKSKHSELLDALSELGLKTTSEAITASLAKLFPSGVEKLDQGVVLKNLFQDIKRSQRTK